MAQRKSIARAIKQAAQGAADEAPAAHRQLKMLAAEHERAAEDLIREALRDLFTKYGKPGIA